jgi:hypothetical protein
MSIPLPKRKHIYLEHDVAAACERLAGGPSSVSRWLNHYLRARLIEDDNELTLARELRNVIQAQTQALHRLNVLLEGPSPAYEATPNGNDYTDHAGQQ